MVARRSSARRSVVVLGVVIAAAGCGLGVEGEAAVSEGTPPDATTSAPDGAAAVDADDAGDASADADAGCSPTIASDPLTTLDANKWVVVANAENAGYPQITTPGGAAPGSWLELVHDVDFAKGGVWWRQKLATRAFDVSFAVYVACGSKCGDGVAFAWVDAPTTDGLADGDNGAVVGMPKNVAGGAAELDFFQNDELGDGPAPSVSVLGLEASKSPGTYAWVVASSPKDDALENAVHTISLRLRAGVVHASVDGKEVTSGAVASGFAGYAGFTAANGGFNGRVFVRDFSAKTYACDPTL